MKNVFFEKKFIPFLIIVFSAINVFADDPPMFNYIGTEACGKCHKSEKQGKQLIIWKESIHAGAYKTLLSEDAIKIAKEMGFDKLPHELVECLVCHASGYDVDNERLEVGFKIEDGVQCETCHGAGSEYKTIKIMKDRNLALQKGLNNIFEKTEELCTGCHNPDSPTFSGFEFETMWAKIEHYLPVKKIEN
ncbi:MAG: multiheme c-type cytochrome [Melioribacteraceae bacterium]